MKFLDSHCHLHDSRIVSDIEGIVERARLVNIQYMVSCATMEDNFELTAQLSEKFDAVLPCFGLHPWFIHLRSKQWKACLEKYLVAYPSGIGETGLDFTDKSWNRDDQIKVFEHHLKLSIELKRPINIHIRNAWDAFNHVLKKTGKLPVPGLIHSYSGSADMVPIFERYNLYISFSGSVTHPLAKKVVKALKIVSKDKFVLETDTPDIYPYLDEPDNKHLNEPKNLPAIAHIASRRVASGRIGISEQKFVAHAYENAKTLFHPLLKGRKEL